MIRHMVEQNEKLLLSKYAVWSVNTKGREYPITPCDIRTEFQRDRDRIIHCKSFRRLKFKTQVFLSPEGDHYRTRLTHTLEVSQIARTISRALRLNEDLTEAAALGHDLGHTPFGHAGERVLREVTGHFEHNEQSLRIVEKLENGKGLNLTWEVRDGILNHKKSGKPATLEAMAVNFADRIAYLNHDIDDALRAGLFSVDDLPQECLEVLGKTHGERIDTMIRDIIFHSMDQPVLSMSDEIGRATDLLREFMFQRLYTKSLAKKEEQKAENIIRMLFEYYRKRPDKLPEEQKRFLEEYGEQQCVVDYIAGMTDRYAMHCFSSIFLPKSWEKM